MTFKTLATAACIAFSSATASSAAPINLDFTVGGVSGTFYGLDDEIGGYQSASSFDLTTPIAIWTGLSASEAIYNRFGFSQFGLIYFDFYIVPNELDDTEVLGYLVDFSVTQLFNDPAVSRFLSYFVFTGDDTIDDFRQTVAVANFTISPISPVPLPAGGLLLLSGLAGVVALKRRKKRTA